MIDEFIHDHVLKHFYGYELMMTPYALAHLKMKSLLDKNDYSLGLPRSRILLVNALDAGKLRTEQSDLSDIGRSVSKEARCAYKVNKRDEIIAVIGNPPYSGYTANKGMYDEEIGVYSAGIKVDKDGLKKEIYIRSLYDDYIKFIRFAHKQIDDKGNGIVGLITNNSYLGGIIHRGMREELMKSFDKIYILNLRGNIINGIKGDKNVFDIKQGVSIAIFVKTSDNQDCKVYYNELIGSRDYKYDYLNNNIINTTDWKEIPIAPCKPYYFFEPKDFSMQSKYDEFVSISDIFKDRSLCMITARDNMTIQHTKEKMWDVINDFCSMDSETARYKYNLRNDTRDWKVLSAQNDVKKSGLNSDLIRQLLYRPFDKRYTYYTGNSKGIMSSPCRKIMKHMTNGNIGLLTSRIEHSSSVCHTYVCDEIVDIHTIPNGSYLCPLYLCSDNGTKKPNISSSIITKLTTAYETAPTPEDIFYYIYGILYSNIYRTKYAEFLKIDFPKIPFTADHELFVKIGKAGKKLVDLHLMKPEVFTADKEIKYQGSGDNVIGTPKYVEDSKQVMINKDNYFDGVDADVWTYQIGGYRPAEKWLKDRKGDTLTLDDVNHYRCICNALKATIELQTEIDEMYNDVESAEIINLSQKFMEITDYIDQ